jgi:DNA-binding transcriptional LysR family regulator
MHQTNLNALDLNLLPPLEALLTRRNVTQAARDVGLSQPAMSRALARLRDLLGDPLLVRGHGGLVLTPLAQSLIPRVAGATLGIRGVFAPVVFDPAQERTLKVAASDVQTVLLAPLIMARLAREAPRLDLVMERYTRDMAKRMEHGELDCAFAITTSELPPGAMSEPVAEDPLVLVMRADHPLARKKWKISDYSKFAHVGISIFGDGQSELDAQLAAAGVRRRMSLVTPHFTAALAAVASTDMVTTVSETFARQFAPTFGLIVKDAPLPVTNLTMTLVWNHVRNADPVLTWFRTVVRDVAERIYARATATRRKV